MFVVVSELHEVVDVSLPLEGHNKGPTIYLLQVDWCRAVKKSPIFPIGSAVLKEREIENKCTMLTLRVINHWNKLLG